jgi:coat protein Gp5
MSATVTVKQNALVLNTFMAKLQNELVSPDLVKWNEHTSELDDTNKLQVIEQVAPRYTVTRTSNGVKDLSGGVDGSAFGSETFTIDGTFNANMGWGDFIKIRDVGTARESEALMGAATNMAEQIDAYILGIAFKAANNWVGTAGNNITDFNDFMSGYTRLKQEGVGDNDLYGVLTFDDKQALGNQIGKLSAPDAEASKAIRVGFKGDLGGIPTVFTQQLPVFTTGSRGGDGSSAALVNGATQNVNYSAVCNSSTNGQYLTQTISIDTLTGTQTLKAGDVFTILGVNAYDNRAQVDTGRLQQFVVVADAAAVSGAIAALRIFPAMIVAGSGSGDDVNINTAHATITAAPADNAALTIKGAASTSYRQRGIIQKGAVTVDTVPLIMPATGTAMRKKLQTVPISVRMWQHSDFGTGTHSVRFDCALNANIRDRRRIVRVNGA